MSVMVTAEFKFKPEAADKMIETFKAILPDTRAYAGNEGLQSYYEASTQSLLLVETWESSEHQQAYLGLRVESGLLDQIGDGLAADPAFRTFDIREDV